MARIGVITGVERRRRWSVEQCAQADAGGGKRAVVAAAFAPGAVVADVARRADLCPSLIYRWRREFAAPWLVFPPPLTSAAIAAGQGLPMIGKLLGHTQVQTTVRYAHLAADPVKAAAEQVSAVIANAVLGRTSEKAAVNE